MASAGNRTEAIAESLSYQVRAWRKLAAPEVRAVLRRSTFAGEPPYDDFGGLNGQSFRARTVLNLLHGLPIDAFVETGTFHGVTSALIAAQTRVPVYTVETKRRYFLAAQPWRLRFPRRLHMVHADSRSFLGSAVLDGLSMPLFYLDAHWNDDLPLVGELDIITRRFAEAVVVIDDFKVPGDDDYGYDVYGDSALDMDLIRPALPAGSVAYFPSVPAVQETGAPISNGQRMKTRGWVVVGWTPAVIAALDAEPGLRREAV